MDFDGSSYLYLPEGYRQESVGFSATKVSVDFETGHVAYCLSWDAHGSEWDGGRDGYGGVLNQGISE